MRRFLLPLLLAATASAAEPLLREVADPDTDTHVEISTLFSKPSPGGWFPVRVKVANNLPKDQIVRLDFSGVSGYSSGSRCDSHFNLDTPAGKVVTRDLLVPLSPDGGNGEDHRVELRLHGTMGEAYGSTDWSLSAAQPAVLLSEDLYTPHGSVLDAATTSKFSGTYRSSNEFAAKFAPAELPAEWLAYSGYDAVVMTDGDWTEAPAGSRNALLSWLRLGGHLVICPPSNTITAASLGLPADPGLGRITLFPISHSDFDAEGLVETVTASRSTTANLPSPRHTSFRTDYESNWPLQALFGTKPFQYKLFIIVLVVFAIVVGPVNLFVFAKTGRRHLLFLTTPLISLVASLLLIGIILFQDGFGGSGFRQVLMEVRPDGDVNAAFIHQEQISRTGVLTGSGFTLPAGATITPVAIAESRWARFTTRNSEGAYNLAADDGKTEASGDWFRSRSELGHAISAVIPTRGRIESTDRPGTLLSTFDFPIDRLYFLHDDGTWSAATGITPGKQFTLNPISAKEAHEFMVQTAAHFAGRNKRMLALATERKGHFVALTAHAPGIDTLPGIRWQRTETVITGPLH